ncbi:MAG: bifunctional 4-hydroxy-2-oxoglutarate aldolase/2-dehydro-3-deoxy-phosphogluconate aldolase [Cellvibrionaceae bacterium]
MINLPDLLQSIKIVPVLTIESLEDAIPICQALSRGGINAAEITLRTSVALEAIKLVKEEMPDFIVGAGTIKKPKDIEALAKICVSFGVSPGFTQLLSDCAFENELLFLPGIATPSELLTGIEAGRSCFKLFPAEAVGGIPLLKSMAPVFDDITFCPTGGVNPKNYQEYLSLPNVVCVGGSWMVSPTLIAEKKWSEIEILTRQAIDCVID